MKTFADQNEAYGWMLMLNRASRDGSVSVLVDGPDEGEWTVMPLKDAIEAEFLYEWAI